jgi:hypothetical protein
VRTADDGESEDLAPWRAIDPSRRRFRRWTVDLEAELRLAERTFTCLVHDLSPGGARIDLTGTEAPAIGTEVVLTMDGYGSISSEVRYAEGGELGLRFIHDSADEVRLARFLVAQAPPRQPPRHAVEIGGLLTAGNVQVSCAVADLSDSGARVRLRDTDHLSEGDRVVLHIDGHGDLAATVRRIGDAEIGVAFEQPSETAPVEATGSGSVLTRLRNWLRRGSS